MAAAARRAIPLVLIFLVSAPLYAADASAAAAGAGANSSSFLLAAEQTQRKDPLDGLRYYTGGWNISDEHYWASVGFTAAPVFAAAAVWFVVFGIGLFIAGCCFCCCPGAGDAYSRACLCVSLVLLLVATAAAAVGCAVLYDGQGRFHGSTVATVDYVVRQSGDTVANLQRFTGFLETAKAAGVGPVALPDDVKGRIDDVVRKVGAASDELAARTASNAAKIRAALETVDACTVRYFPPPAQRGGRHVRGDGRVGAAPAGAHGAGRHPAVRRHGRGQGGAEPEQGGELPAGGRAQRRAHQRLQPRLPAAGPAAAQLQPVGPARAAALQPLRGGPPRPRVRAGRGAPRRHHAAAGVAAIRVPWRLRGRRVGGRGVHVPGARHAVHVRAAHRRGRRQLRAVPLRPRPGGAGGLHLRQGDVPVHRRRPLPGPQPVQRPGVPGLARRRRRRAAGSAALGRALAGAPAAERGHGDPVSGLVALQVSSGGEGVSQEPREAVHVI
uniref:Uncharacterized protein n=1 Tax=Zea mays TaxID=4577 RepID=C0HGN9_MAIZE|nr:unknown [Zea mays]